jgi:DtxR family transcriptional regulator, Mn-dependent transcriptional regulator
VARLSEAAEDYVKAVWALSRDGRVTTTALASELGVSAASTTAMLKKLARLKLVNHEPYHGVTLTPAGERVALEVVRHHRLVERFLVEALGVPWDEVHDEAERWEHVLSEGLEQRMDAALGFPTTDPHGDPIPDAKLRLSATAFTPLAALAAGDAGTVRRVPDGDAALLRYLAEVGIVPGETIEIRTVEPFEGPLTVRSPGGERSISRELAGRIEVTPC